MRIIQKVFCCRISKTHRWCICCDRCSSNSSYKLSAFRIFLRLLHHSYCTYLVGRSNGSRHLDRQRSQQTNRALADQSAYYYSVSKRVARLIRCVHLHLTIFFLKEHNKTKQNDWTQQYIGFRKCYYPADAKYADGITWVLMIRKMADALKSFNGHK